MTLRCQNDPVTLCQNPFTTTTATTLMAVKHKTAYIHVT